MVQKIIDPTNMRMNILLTYFGLIDFSSISTCLGLFHAQSLENHVGGMFILTFFVKSIS